MSQLTKRLFGAAGLKLERLDPDVEAIPRAFHTSPFLPKIYKENIGVIPYFATMLELASPIAGDIVECGVSIGQSLLLMMLLEHAAGRERRFLGFDSFEGFPASTEQDRTGRGDFTAPKGYFATPPSIVLRTLRDGRVPDAWIDENLILVKGFFEDTTRSYSGSIAVLHLDCDLYESYLTCLQSFYKLVAPGGVILFDEYEDTAYPGAKVAIDQFFADKPEQVVHYAKLGYRKSFAIKT